jgi:hypothetical protein
MGLFFGRAQSKPHSKDRSLQNLKDLKTLCFDEAAGGQATLESIFQQGLKTPETSRYVSEYGVTITRTVRIDEIGAIDVKYFYPEGNLNATPEVSTIIPKIFTK